MNELASAIDYFLTHRPEFWEALTRHLTLSLTALAISIAVCVPVGIWIARRQQIAPHVISFFSSLRVLPSLVILFLAWPYLGLGFGPALVALTVLAFPPVLINTYTGIQGVEPSILEAARGMGMSARQRLLRIELPLSSPAILGGVRTAGVEVVASAALAALIGGGGLGDFIIRGYALYRADIMLVGAVAVALLAVGSEALLAGLQHWLSEKYGAPQIVE